MNLTLQENDFWLIPLVKCDSWRRATNRCKKQNKTKQNKNFEIVESALYMKSGTIPYADFRLACRYAAWSSLVVSELQLSAATPLWLYHRAASLPSWIEFNCLRSAAVGKAARLSIYWHDAACRLVIPLRQVALAQLNKYQHQSGKRQVSLKPALGESAFHTILPSHIRGELVLFCLVFLFFFSLFVCLFLRSSNNFVLH